MKKALFLLAVSGVVVSVACSSSTEGSSSGSPQSDAAILEDAQIIPVIKDSGKQDAAPTETVEECQLKCTKTHAAGYAKDQAIETCWSAKCAGPCIGEPDGGTTPSSDGGTCKNEVDTTDPDCDACTHAACCAEWDGCFDDADCTAYQDCYFNCEP